MELRKAKQYARQISATTSVIDTTVVDSTEIDSYEDVCFDTDKSLQSPIVEIRRNTKYPFSPIENKVLISTGTQTIFNFG